MEDRRNLYLGNDTHFQMIMTDVTEDEMRMAIRAHMAQTERPSHYLRYWEEDGVRWFDYGSWSTFFIWARREDYDRLLLKSKEMEEMNG